MRDKIEIDDAYIYVDVDNALKAHGDLLDEYMVKSLNGSESIWGSIEEEIINEEDALALHDKLCDTSPEDLLKYIRVHRNEMSLDYNKTDLCAGYLAYKVPITVNLKKMVADLRK